MSVSEGMSRIYRGPGRGPPSQRAQQLLETSIVSSASVAPAIKGRTLQGSCGGPLEGRVGLGAAGAWFRAGEAGSVDTAWTQPGCLFWTCHSVLETKGRPSPYSLAYAKPARGTLSPSGPVPCFLCHLVPLRERSGITFCSRGSGSLPSAGGTWCRHCCQLQRAWQGPWDREAASASRQS